MKRLFIILSVFAFVVSCNGQSQNNEPVISKDDGMIIFEKPGDIMNIKEFKVFQSLDKGYALATGLSDAKYKWYYGPVVLLHQEGKYYYDEEVVKTPKKMKEYQIGVYRYQTKNDNWKTVPIIQFMDEKSFESYEAQ